MKAMYKLLFLISIIWLSGCQEEYYFDGGLSDANLNMSTFDFLKSRPDEFEKLVWIIEQNNLQDLIDQSNSTFFASKDAAIDKYLVVMELDDYQFTKLPPEEVKKLGELVKSYLINETIKRENITTQGKEYLNLKDEKVKVSFQETPYNGVSGYGPKYVLFTTYTIFTDPATNESIEIQNTATVATSDLVSTNGIVHVLQATSHVFGR